MLAECWRYVIGSVVYTAEIQVMVLEQRIDSMYDNRQLWVYEGILLHLSESNSADTCTLKEGGKECELRV